MDADTSKIDPVFAYVCQLILAGGVEAAERYVEEVLKPAHIAARDNHLRALKLLKLVKISETV